MSCQRAFEIELDDLLLTPEVEEFREFEEHARGCEDCADELSLQRGLLGKLRRDEAASAPWHPADELLLQLRKDPEAIPSHQLERVQDHLSACPRCTDAFEAYRWITGMAAARSAPEPLLSRLAETLRAAFALLPSPAATAAAAAIVLALGLFVSLPLAPSPEEGATLQRGAGEEAGEQSVDRAGVEVAIVAGHRTVVEADTLRGTEQVALRLLLPLRRTEPQPIEIGAILDEQSSVVLKVLSEGGRSYARLTTTAQRLGLGVHRIRVLESTGEVRFDYELEVR